MISSSANHLRYVIALSEAMPEGLYVTFAQRLVEKWNEAIRLRFGIAAQRLAMT